LVDHGKPVVEAADIADLDDEELPQLEYDVLYSNSKDDEAVKLCARVHILGADGDGAPRVVFGGGEKL
jgi:hypothetical protein